MIKASLSDRQRIVDILSESFDANKSVNYIIKPDAYRRKRIRRLMEYSFDVCHHFGRAYLSNDKKACALIILPDKKRTNLKSVTLDLKLIFFCCGLQNIKRTINREAKIKRLQPQEPMYYLWFIGVEASEQGKGIGSQLLSEIIAEAKKENRIICLETSVNRNLPWYQSFGFEIYAELDFGYRLYLLKREMYQ